MRNYTKLKCILLYSSFTIYSKMFEKTCNSYETTTLKLTWIASVEDSLSYYFGSRLSQNRTWLKWLKQIA